jgi:hypothetical protein
LYGKSAATLATAWALVVTLGSFLVGGYIAGRMRMTWAEGNPAEVEFRDGVHGFLVWSLSILIGGLFASIVGTTTTLVGAQAGRASVSQSERASVLASPVDVLLRSTQGTQQPTGPLAGADLRDEVTRILTSSVLAAQLTASNRGYLAELVAQRAGIPAPQAEKRVDDVYSEVVRVIEQARRTTVLVGLVVTTALMFGLVATWYAAQRGGHHRDNNIPAKFHFFRKPYLKI